VHRESNLIISQQDATSNIQYNQSRILNYASVIIAMYFTHCSQSIPEAAITAVPAADDGCQHPKHVDLPTEM